MWVHYPIISVSYPVCSHVLVDVLELEVVLELELDQDHVVPPSGHQLGPTHRDAPLLPCLPNAPGRSGPCYVRAGLSCPRPQARKLARPRCSGVHALGVHNAHQLFRST